MSNRSLVARFSRAGLSVAGISLGACAGFCAFVFSATPIRGQQTPTAEPQKAPDVARPTAPVPQAAPAVAGKLEDFAWLAGRWTGKLERSRMEEIWSKPDAGMMMGMFRLVSDEGRTMIVEMMTLRQVGDSVEMSLRHFDEKLTGWEPIDDASEMRLTKNAAGEFEFSDPEPNLEQPKRGQPLRQIWRPSGDTLKFEVFAPRSGQEKKIIEGEMKRSPQ